MIMGPLFSKPSYDLEQLRLRGLEPLREITRLLCPVCGKAIAVEQGTGGDEHRYTTMLKAKCLVCKSEITCYLEVIKTTK